jgi:hypothetical protein
MTRSQTHRSVGLAQYDRRAHLSIIFNLRSTPLYPVRLIEARHFRHNGKTYSYKLKSLGEEM